jgi:hypothetical protein
MDITLESFEKVTFELREHSDGRWDMCIVCAGEKTHKLSRLPFKKALSELEKVMAVRKRLLSKEKYRVRKNI